MPGNVFRSILASNCRKADRFQAKRERGAKRRLHRFRFSGRIGLSGHDLFPALPGTGPPSTAGFVFLDGLFSTAGAMPANLPVGRDLTIRRKIENGRYYCAFGRSKAHHPIRAPRRAQTRALLKPPPRAPVPGDRRPDQLHQRLPAARVIAGDDLGRLHWLEIVD
jgi:hypothetical protein